MKQSTFYKATAIQSEIDILEELQQRLKEDTKYFFALCFSSGATATKFSSALEERTKVLIQDRLKELKAEFEAL